MQAILPHTFLPFKVHWKHVVGAVPKKKEKVFVSGKVVNKKGKPVKKATVIVIDQNYNSVAELETDKEGLFTIENLKPADYNLTISKRKMLVKFKLKSWPKNNQNIKEKLWNNS